MGLKASQRHARVPLLLEMDFIKYREAEGLARGEQVLKFEPKTLSYETDKNRFAGLDPAVRPIVRAAAELKVRSWKYGLRFSSSPMPVFSRNVSDREPTRPQS